MVARSAFPALKARVGGDPGWRGLIQGTGVALVLRIGGAGLGLAFNLLLARSAGAEGAGLFFLAFSVSGLLALASRLGLDAIVVRRTAAAAAKGEWLAVRADAHAALAITLIAAGVASVGLWLLAPLVSEAVFHKPELVPAMRGLVFAILPIALSVIFAELLRGLHSLVRSQALQALVAGAVALPLLGLFVGDFGIGAAVWAQVAGNSVACALGAWWWRDEIRAKGAAMNPDASAPAVASRARYLHLLGAARPLFYFSMLGALMGTLDILVLGKLGSATDVGIYAIAVRLAMLTSFILLASNSYAGPYFAAAYAKRDLDALHLLAIRSAQVTALAATPLLILFVALPSTLLGFFGREFIAGAPVLMVLAVGQFVNVVTGSAGQVLIMAGHERDMRNASFLAAAVTIAGLVALVPKWGALGAAMATAGGVVTQKLVATMLVHKRLGLTVHAFARPRRTAGTDEHR